MPSSPLRLSPRSPRSPGGRATKYEYVDSPGGRSTYSRVPDGTRVVDVVPEVIEVPTTEFVETGYDVRTQTHTFSRHTRSSLAFVARLELDVIDVRWLRTAGSW